MENFLRDLRDAFRGLRKSAVLVSICVLSLGLVVGVNLTLVSWLSAMVFDPPTIASTAVALAASRSLAAQRGSTRWRPCGNSNSPHGL